MNKARTSTPKSSIGRAETPKRRGHQRVGVLGVGMMLSVVIPTRNDERALVTTLSALVPGVADGVVRDVIIADFGSTDATLEVADVAGCTVIAGGDDRAALMNLAARRAKGPWLLFLEADITLTEGWHREVRGLIDTLERTQEADRRAAVFTFGVDGLAGRDRVAERLAGLWGMLTGLPRPEQGLMLNKRLFDGVGGFRALPAMAEADLIGRIGRRRILRLRARALAPARRPASGLWRSGARGALGAGLLMLRVPPRVVARLYG